MSSQQYGLLDPDEEYELHKSRLLNVEEKPFKRITKRLVTPGAFTNPNAKKLPTPPPDAADGSSQDALPEPTSAAEVTAFKEDIAMDFAAFDTAIARLQFLATANAAERERYAADRLRILGTMESVRGGNAGLRAQLDEARATLAQRRKFDELADKITGNRMLRTRAEQAVGLDKLAEECEELQRESETYGGTWLERKQQFDKLVDEGVSLRRLIRDEKEEVERREGMDDGGEDGEPASPGKGSQSGNATPARPSDGNATPRPGSSAGRTPRGDSPGPNGTGGNESLKPNADTSGSFSRAGSQVPSVGAGSQAPRDDEPEEGEDIEMGEPTAVLGLGTPLADSTAEGTPQITVDAPETSGDSMDMT